jgi:hypothetical protein
VTVSLAVAPGGDLNTLVTRRRAGCGRVQSEQRHVEDQVMLHRVKAHDCSRQSCVCEGCECSGSPVFAVAVYVRGLYDRHRDVPTKISTNGY